MCQSGQNAGGNRRIFYRHAGAWIAFLLLKQGVVAQKWRAASGLQTEEGGIYPGIRTLQPGLTPFRRKVRWRNRDILLCRLTRQNALHPPERIAKTIANRRRFD
jgi:hypothetical protein